MTPIETAPRSLGRVIREAATWFWKQQGHVVQLWGFGGLVTWMLPAVTHWWPAAFWEVTASSIAVGLCYLGATACGIHRFRSAFAGLAMIAVGVAWSINPNGVALLPLWCSLVVAVVAILLAARAADADRG